MKIKELTTDEYALFSSARVLEGEDFESAVFSSFWTSTEAASSLFLRLGSEPMGEPCPSAESTASLSWVLLLKTVSAVLHPNALDLSKKIIKSEWNNQRNGSFILESTNEHDKEEQNNTDRRSSLNYKCTSLAIIPRKDSLKVSRVSYKNQFAQLN